MNDDVIHYLFQTNLDTERKASRNGYEDVARSCRNTQIQLIKNKVIGE